MWVSEAARKHYRALAVEESTLVIAGRKSWRKVEPDYPVESWRRIVRQEFMPIVATQQVRAATLGAESSSMILADQGFWSAPTGFVDPQALAGVNPRGGNLEGQLLEPAYQAERVIRQGVKPAVALSEVEHALFAQLVTALADTSGAAAGMDIALRPEVGYVRVIHGSACKRCVVLAGKYYRWNEGFKRHPQCRCTHEATTKPLSGDLYDDPYELFESLSVEEQDKRWGKNNAEAIREGADIFQVTNASRGMTKTRMFTTEGMSRRGYAAQGLKPGQRRLTPEAIYKQADGSRLKARELLTEHGYLLHGVQVPTGSIRGQVPGFGHLGKGGKARAASESVTRARLTGVRDPSNRYTMTAAERRLYDAETRYSMVLRGENPFASPGFGNTPDPYGLRLNTKGKGPSRPLTPQIASMVEKDYRRWLATGGQIFT